MVISERSSPRSGSPGPSSSRIRPITVEVIYAIANRIVGQNAEAFGDANDRFGGIGRDGVLHVLVTDKGTDGALLPVTGTYAFQRGKIANLLADNYIKNRCDVTNPEVANAVAQVILTL